MVAEEIIRDGEHGYLVEPGNVSGIADRVLRLLNNANLRVAIGRRGAAGIPVEFRYSSHGVSAGARV